MNRRKFLGLLAPLAVVPLVAKAIASSAPIEERNAAPCDCLDTAASAACNPGNYSDWPPDCCAVTDHGISKQQLIETVIRAHWSEKLQEIQDRLDYRVIYGDGSPEPRGIIKVSRQC